MTLTEHFEIQLALEMGIPVERLRKLIRLGQLLVSEDDDPSPPVRTYAFLCLASERGLELDQLDALLSHKCPLMTTAVETDLVLYCDECGMFENSCNCIATSPTSQDLINASVLDRLEMLEKTVAEMVVRAAYPMGRPIA